MIARVLAVFRLPVGATAVPKSRVRSQRKSARAAVVCGLIAFIASNVALARVLEVSHPEWQEPEFGYRLIQLRQWKTKAPNRPLVLAVGSSRIQQGIDSAAMGFGDEPTATLVFNFGYRGSSPIVSTLNVCRILDAGIRPDYVLVEFSPIGILPEHSAAAVLRAWPNRLTVGDVWWMANAGFIESNSRGTRAALGQWVGTVSFPWTSHRQVLQTHWLPNWATPMQRATRRGERMDEYGFTSMLGSRTTKEHFTQNADAARISASRIASQKRVAASSLRASAVLIERCRSEGIPVAFVWAPTSPFVAGWLSSDGQRASAEYAAALTREFGVPVFPPPDDMNDEDFADGHHLLPGAAKRYSRWLADTHLKPWLAQLSK